MIQVLIVDDEKLEREGIKYLLAMEEGEWNIREASNGRDALQILKNEETDLLLTDIKMPHMDGLWAYGNYFGRSYYSCKR